MMRIRKSFFSIIAGAPFVCSLSAETVLRVELGGSTGKVATSATESVTTSTNTTRGTHTGIVDFGFVGSASQVAISSTGNDPGLNAISTFIDNFTITSPSYASFVSGSMTVTLTFQGGLALAPSGLSPGDGVSGGTLYRLNLYHTTTINPIANGTPVINETGRLDYDRLFSEEITTTGTVPPSGEFEIEIPFKFGVPTQIKLQLLTASFGRITDLEPMGASIEADAAFMSGARWTGVSEIRHFSGTVVTDYSIATESGVNWLEPEPLVYISDVGAGLSATDGMNNRYLEMVLTRIKPGVDVQYQIETSDALSGWLENDPGSGQPLTEIVATNSLDETTERITIRDKTPYSVTGNRFIRIQAVPVGN